MAAELTNLQRRGRGKTGIVKGTKGMYDKNEVVRSQTARAMVASRETVDIACALTDCDHGDGGLPKVFTTRLVDGAPEARACCSVHRLKLWRYEMRMKGYQQKTINGVLGWMTPDGIFHPSPSQPRKRRGDRGVTYVWADPEAEGKAAKRRRSETVRTAQGANRRQLRRAKRWRSGGAAPESG